MFSNLSFPQDEPDFCLTVLPNEKESAPLGVVVLLHDVSRLLTGQEEVPWLIELQVHGVFVHHAEVILRGTREETDTG